MKKITVKTSSSKEVVDITDQVESIVRENKIEDGVVNLFLTHTTAALTTADLDPGTDKDIMAALEKIIPRLQFRHPHNPSHAPDHILSSLVGTDLSVPVSDSRLVLGEWQRIVLLEFDGPRERKIVVNFK